MNNKQKALKISLIALLCTLLVSLIVYALIEINNTNVRKTLEEELKNALKVNSPEYVTKPVEEYNITIFKQDGKYIWGGISEKSIDELKNENTQSGDFNGFVGASFYAYKAEDGWKTIYAGQDSPLCSDVEKYNFPKDIYQYCNDQQIEQVVDDLSLYSIKCLPVNPQSLATKTQITYKGNEIFNFTSENEFYEGYIIGKIENNLYFVNQVGGLGGFMLYGNLGFIYKLNLDTLKLENIYVGDYIYNKDFVFYGEKKDFNILYFKTGITKKFTNIDLDGYQHGTYYISPKGENIAIPFSSVNPDGVGVGGIMLLNLSTGELKEIYKEDNSVPYISGWENENTPNIKKEINEFSDENIGISFVYRSELGNIISEKNDNLQTLKFSEYDNNGLFLVANDGKESSGRGAFWGDEAHYITDQEYINNFCNDKKNCTIKTNNHGIKFAKLIDEKYTMDLSCSIEATDNSCKTEKAVFYYLYNPNSQYKGIVVSSATMNNAVDPNMRDKEYLMDIIVSSIKYIK